MASYKDLGPSADLKKTITDGKGKTAERSVEEISTRSGDRAGLSLIKPAAPKLTKVSAGAKASAGKMGAPPRLPQDE